MGKGASRCIGALRVLTARPLAGVDDAHHGTVGGVRLVVARNVLGGQPTWRVNATLNALAEP